MCPIPKGGDRTAVSNYRPMSLLSNIHKLRAAGISVNLLDWFTNYMYLFKRRQRVVLPGVESLWTFIKTGAPQGSILGPFLFLLFINAVLNEIHANIRLFADDTVYILLWKIRMSQHNY